MVFPSTCRLQLRLPALTLTIAAAIGGTSLDWRRALYDVGDQHACMQSKHDKLGEVGEDAACLDPSNPKRTEYVDCNDNRERECGKSPP